MGVREDLVAALQAYAYSRRSDDPDFYAAFGPTGSKVEIRNITEDTGQVFLNDPNMMDATFQAIEDVVGNWRSDDFTLLLTSSVELSYTPSPLATLQVFYNGLLLRRVASPSGTGEYSVSGKTITFGSALTGWFQAHYLTSTQA